MKKRVLVVFAILFCLRVATHAAVPNEVNDPLRPQQGYLDEIGVPKLWNSGIIGSSRPDLTFVVLDNGTSLHPDLLHNMDTARSVSFVENRDPFSDRGNHGTKVAGVACGVGNNAMGITGVAQRCNILVMKVGEVVEYPDGRKENTVSEGAVMTAFYSLLTNVPGVLVVNASIIADGLVDSTGMGVLGRVIEAGKDRMIVFAAAGNDTQPGSNYSYRVRYPCGLAKMLPNVVCVTSFGRNHDFEWYANHDPIITTVAAPTVLLTTSADGGYGLFGGTSASTPVAAGVGYLWLSGLMDKGVRVDANVITRIKQAMRDGGRSNPALGIIPELDAWGGWELLREWFELDAPSPSPPQFGPRRPPRTRP